MQSAETSESQLQRLLVAKQRLDAQFGDISSYWNLLEVFECTRGSRDRIPDAVLDLIRRKALADSSPEASHEIPLENLKAMMAARAQAMLNLRNITMLECLSGGKRTFPDSSRARLIEAMAWRQCFSNADDLDKALADAAVACAEAEAEAEIARADDEAETEAAVVEITRTASARADDDEAAVVEITRTASARADDDEAAVVEITRTASLEL